MGEMQKTFYSFVTECGNTSAVCSWKLVCTYSWGKMKSGWRMNVMKDLMQAWTDDFLT